MNLVKELHKTASKNYNNQLKEANESLESVKANLEMQDGKDQEMLRFFGTGRVVIEQKRKVHEVKAFISNEFLTREDIKSVCVSYNLRFLPAKLYKKEIPLQALNDLRKFREKYNISDWVMGQNLSIIAPANHFSLGPRPAKDPVLIYKFNDNNYQIISTWGNDFKFTRRISGFVNAYPGFTMLLIALLFFNGIFTYYVVKENTDPSYYFFNIGIMMIVGFIRSEMSDSEQLWDRPHE